MCELQNVAHWLLVEYSIFMSPHLKNVFTLTELLQCNATHDNKIDKQVTVLELFGLCLRLYHPGSQM